MRVVWSDNINKITIRKTDIRGHNELIHPLDFIRGKKVIINLCIKCQLYSRINTSTRNEQDIYCFLSNQETFSIKIYGTVR